MKKLLLIILISTNLIGIAIAKPIYSSKQCPPPSQITEKYNNNYYMLPETCKECHVY